MSPQIPPEANGITDTSHLQAHFFNKIGAQQAFPRGGAKISNAPLPAVRRTTIGRLKSIQSGVD
jgi:hypothetical protein